jgi:hypothetical protein
MYLAAQALGLGARIYAKPVSTINAQYLSTLDIPRGYEAVAILRIGKRDNVDTVSAVSTRKNPFSLFNYR